MGTIDLLIVERIVRKETGTVAVHTHPFWQLEIVLRGPISYSWQDQRGDLQAGDMLLVAPDVEHSFRYDRHGCSWITLKFINSSETGRLHEGAVIRNSLFNDQFITALQTMVTGPILNTYERIFVEGFIQSLFQYLVSQHTAYDDNADYTLVRTVKDLVRKRGGKAVNINELAEQMSYTRSHLSKQFRSLSGENLKGFIDRIRLEKAKELLLYSEYAIAEISEVLGFKDLFSFSRFFKRGTGESPRSYRNQRFT